MSEPSSPTMPEAAAAGLAATYDAAAEPPASSAGHEVVSQRLGRFVVLRLLGQGGMGKVYAAYDEQLDRKVAVKLLHSGATAQGSHRLGVMREAQAMARVSHPNVVQVFEVGELADQIFIAMEFIDGMTLTTWQRTEARPWKEILQVYRAAGQGLWAAHQVGLVHRDFKPDNVLLDRAGRARVVDFGLARLQQGLPTESAPQGARREPALATRLTQEGAIAGTPGYMSPEQYLGAAVEQRSDQFSFCAALYEALYGSLPFAGATIAEQASNVLAGRLLPPPSGSPVPAEIHAALQRGLAVEPTQRFASMAEILSALAIDHERDAAGAWFGRRRFTGAYLALTLVLSTLYLLGHRDHAPSVKEMVGGSVANTIMLSLVLFLLRRSLLRNAFHRGVMALVAINIFEMTGFRLTGWLLGLPVHLFVPLDLLVIAGLVAILAQRYFAVLWPLVALFISGALLVGRRPDWLLWTQAVLYPLLPCSVLFAWSRASRLPHNALSQLRMG